MVEELQVPIHLKMTLTTKEAAEYSNIGINKIDSMLRTPNCPFVQQTILSSSPVTSSACFLKQRNAPATIINTR